MGIWAEIKESFKEGSTLTRLTYVNLAIFLIVRILNVLSFLTGVPFPLIDWLSLPADPGQLLARPWTLVSYMFLHFDFLHILFNLLWLYWMGRIFLIYFNQRQLVAIYLIGGIAGGLLYVVGFNSFNVFSQVVADSRLLGASASVIAIVTALAIHAPNHTINLMFIGPVRMKFIALISILMYVIGISSSNAGGNVAHLGGALGGAMFVLWPQFRNIFSKSNASLSRNRATKRNVTVSYRKPNNDIEYNRQVNQDKSRMNEILDKISKSGYDSLTKEEKEFLFRMGNN